MSKRLVFSIRKYFRWYRDEYGEKPYEPKHVVPWWRRCDGLTEEEMDKLGFMTTYHWMTWRKK